MQEIVSELKCWSVRGFKFSDSLCPVMEKLWREVKGFALVACLVCKVIRETQSGVEICWYPMKTKPRNCLNPGAAIILMLTLIPPRILMIVSQKQAQTSHYQARVTFVNSCSYISYIHFHFVWALGVLLLHSLIFIQWEKSSICWFN